MSELTWIKGDIRGTIKTAAVPSGPALIAGDFPGPQHRVVQRTFDSNKIWPVGQQGKACVLCCLHMEHWTVCGAYFTE